MSDEIVKLICEICGDELHLKAEEYESMKHLYNSGARIRCINCLTGRLKPHTPGTAPDTSLHLGDERKDWLRQQGGIQPTIIRLIDEAMQRQAEREKPEFPFGEFQNGAQWSDPNYYD